jgi:sugar/nucleoside kinase (ribokinase family)
MASAERAAPPSSCGGPFGDRRPVVHLFGTVFFDLIFSELSSPPRPGTEVHTKGLGLSPGGSANIAVALARLGADVRLSASFADDAFGHYLRAELDREGVDLSGSSLLSGWTTPLTVSMAYGRDRSMVTYADVSPADASPALPDDFSADACFVTLGKADRAWLETLRRRSGLIVADVGWDPTERWPSNVLGQLALVDVFLPNAAEAVAYTRAASPEEAARALAGHGPLVVVKMGARGAIAAGGPHAEPIRVPALPVEAVDTTGAGDVFDAAFIYGTLARWPVEQRLRFANLCAGESVRFAGGSLSAPCWRDIGAWWERQGCGAVRAAYSFLTGLLETCHPVRICQRPCASMPLAAGMSAASGASTGTRSRHSRVSGLGGRPPSPAAYPP